MSAIFDIELQDAGLPHRDESEDDDIIEIDAVIKASPPSFITRREWESRYLRVAPARDSGTCTVILTPHLFSFSQEECVTLNEHEIVR